MQVQEPSLAFSRGGNLDDGALAPVGVTEVPKLMDEVDDPIHDATIPSRLCSRGGDSLQAMPAPAVRLPRHAGISADGLQSHVALARLLIRRRIVFRPFMVRPRRQH